MSDSRGLTILGEAVGLEPEDAYPVGEETYITDHLHRVSDRLCQDVRNLRHLPGMCGDQQAGPSGLGTASEAGAIQDPAPSANASHTPHLTTVICDHIQAELQENFHYWIQQPPLTADQWKIAEFPITSGGLAFPNLHRQAVVARASCLATLLEFVATQAYRGELIAKERLEFFGRLAPLIGPTSMEVLGDILTPP